MKKTTDFHPDPMGACIWDYFKGDVQAKARVYSSVGGVRWLSGAYLFRTYEQMPLPEQQAIDLACGKVLDVGAGSGCHSIILQEKCTVTALEISSLSAACMRQRGVKNVVEADIFTFDNAQKYDTILLLMNGIGLAGTLEETPRLLEKLKSLLAKGGQIIFDSSDILHLYENDDGSIMLDLTANYYGEVIFQVSYNKQKGEKFPWVFIDFAQMCDLAEQAGLQCDYLCEGETGNYLARLTVMV
ncbi:MAG: class I SAM-dependent methyltransferase [Bacteroidetes bacterium]|nr:class I SAM-dependent methyltransferase [Bacteroidota bacterium]MCB9042889.1 class I SAM-dependent methyltransferase [Chitinophagales bacterium]